MLLLGGPHLSSSSVTLTLSLGLGEDIPLSTWLCFPTTLRAAVEGTKRTERDAHHRLQQFGRLMEVGEGELDGSLRLAPLPGFHHLAGSPTANCALVPPQAPPHALGWPPGPATGPRPRPRSPPTPGRLPGPVGGRGAASTGWRQ